MNTNVEIRPITLEDTDNIVRWRNSQAVTQNFIYRTPLTKQTHLNWFETRIKTGQVKQFIITDTLTGQDVGSVYLRDIDNVNKKAEYGIFIGEESARGKGIGTSAAKLVLSYAFDKLKLNKVFLRVLSENAAAVRSYEKAGFALEGRFNQDVIIDGIPYDVVFMAILRSDWERVK